MDSPGNVTTLTTTEQQQDEVMAQLQPFHRVQLTDNEVLCDYVHSSFLNRDGIIINFINSNATGATTMIGGVRIGLTDIRKAPAYCSKYKKGIKDHGIRMLSLHFIDTQCGAGATEVLYSDDYGISFAVASVSGTGLTSPRLAGMKEKQLNLSTLLMLTCIFCLKASAEIASSRKPKLMQNPQRKRRIAPRRRRNLAPSSHPQWRGTADIPRELQTTVDIMNVNYKKSLTHSEPN